MYDAMHITAATDESFSLGEGPVWDAARGRLLWVDILEGTILEGVLQEVSGDQVVEVTARHHFEEMVAAVAVGPEGTLLVAAQERLVVQQPDGTRQDGPRVLAAGTGRRLNDGSTDPAGRFLVGTMSLEDPSDSETLVRLEPDGTLTELDGDLALSNGLAWSADGHRMYSVDTMRGTVFVRDYDPSTGTSGERREHLRVEGGAPDGVAMDAEEHLWVALFGAGEVRRYAPDGAVVERVVVPAPNTSSVAFAGPDLRTLVITTATSELSQEQLERFPDSGRLFTARIAVPGLVVPPWAGSAAF